MKNWSLRRAALWIGACVLVALIAIAAIGSFVNARQFDSDSRQRSAATRAQLIAGCVRGNSLRKLIGAQAEALRGADLYIAEVLRRAVAGAPAGADPGALARTLKQAAHFEALAARIRAPELVPCERVYGSANTPENT